MFLSGSALPPHRHGQAGHRPRAATLQALLAMPSREFCVGTARRFAADLLRRWGIAQHDRESAVLIVDELTANAAQHGRADTTLLLALEEDMLFIAVADSGLQVPHQRATIAADEHGRGTGIVEFLADHVETHRTSHGCRTCVSLRVTAAAPG